MLTLGVLGTTREEGSMTVWMCSGQGAQSEGMGADLLDILEVREVFERASEVLEIDLDRKSTRLNSSHKVQSRMPSSA